MLRALLYKSWRQHPTKQQLYQPSRRPLKFEEQDKRDTAEGVKTNLYVLYSCGPFYTDVQVLSDQLETYLQQLCTGIGCYKEELSEAMDERDDWRERVREIRPCDTS